MTIEGLSLVAVLLAFAGGVVSFVSPCVLPLVPIYLGHLSGVSVKEGRIEGGRTTFFHSVGFVLGFSVIFIALGATIGVLGGAAGGNLNTVAKVAGGLLVAFGLYMAGFFRLPGLRRLFSPVSGLVDRVYYRERRYQGSFGFEGSSYWKSVGVGGAFAVGWTPCITPVLGAILTLAVTSAAGSTANAWTAAGQAAVLLSFYAAGLSVPFLLSGLMLGRITPMFRRINRYMPAVSLAGGALLVVVGILVYRNMVTELNRYFDFLPYVNF